MIATQADLTADAVRRGYGPGAVCISAAGDYVYVTSWPWYEGTGDDESAIILGRRVIDDPRTNKEWPYFGLMKKVGEFNLDTGDMIKKQPPPIESLANALNALYETAVSVIDRLESHPQGSTRVTELVKVSETVLRYAMDELQTHISNVQDEDAAPTYK